MFTMTVDSTRPYITVTASGPAGLDELSELAARIAEMTKDQAHSRVLADLSRVDTSLSFADHLRFDSLVWELLGGVERLAAIVRPEFLDAAAARAAQMTGTPLKTFLEVKEATRWVAGARRRRRIPVRHRAAERRPVHEG